jgi:hypothetical protein
MAEYDSPWKDAVNEQFVLFLAFCFSDIQQDCDFTQDYESLEQEMRKLVPASLTGKRLVDKLVKLFTRQGDVRYLHVEVQGEAEKDFERRMDTYNYRARDVLGQEVVSVAVLADDDPDWRPREYRFSCWGCRRTLEFVSFKVLDWAGREAELETHENPFALFVLAHLKSRQTRENVEERAQVKLRLILNLHERKLDVEEMQRWYRYFDWLLDLPRERDEQLWQEVAHSKEEKRMAFVTFAERYGMEKGLEKGMEKGQRVGLLKGLATVLELKFGESGKAFQLELERQEKVETLEAVLAAVKTANSVDELRKLLPPAADNAGP